MIRKIKLNSRTGYYCTYRDNDKPVIQRFKTHEMAEFMKTALLKREGSYKIWTK